MTTSILVVYVLCLLTLAVGRRRDVLLLAIALGALSQGALIALSFDSVLIAALYAVFAIALTAGFASKSLLSEPAGSNSRRDLFKGLIGEDAYLVAWVVLAGATVYLLASSQPIIGTLPTDIAIYATIAAIVLSALLSRSNLGMIGAMVLGIGATGFLGDSVAGEIDFLATMAVVLASGIFVGQFLSELVGFQRSDAVGD